MWCVCADAFQWICLQTMWPLACWEIVLMLVPAWLTLSQWQLIERLACTRFCDNLFQHCPWSCSCMTWFRNMHFYCAACNARYCNRNSVRLSVRCMYCDKTKWRIADILIPHEMAIILVFWHQHWLVGDAPFLSNIRQKWPTPFEKHRLIPISTYNISTVRDSKKSLIMTNIKSTTGFPMSNR